MCISQKTSDIILISIMIFIIGLSIFAGIDYDETTERGRFSLGWSWSPWVIINANETSNFAVTGVIDRSYNHFLLGFDNYNKTIPVGDYYCYYELRNIIAGHHAGDTKVIRELSDHGYHNYKGMGYYRDVRFHTEFSEGQYVLYADGIKVGYPDFEDQFIFGFAVFVILGFCLLVPAYIGLRMNSRADWAFLIPRSWRGLPTKYPCPICKKSIKYHSEPQHRHDMADHLEGHAELSGKPVTVTMTISPPKTKKPAQYGLKTNLGPNEYARLSVKFRDLERKFPGCVIVEKEPPGKNDKGVDL